ncbi:EF-P beta-lysylation protein EpmB [Pantoea sp. Aalb]|uniref:EF-P beta-lysylation protein EpmB n=1 Tax=Pantoea sp. Aalb TaxID=2576762 RepID=UPI0013229EC5|nr:EF-P beta-lysylation protein EpmB [Pantoea sp. Aalb]MXP67802.1 EF-P beta-lysylation protein EpmB [Pantoea sp. Aalb]
MLNIIPLNSKFREDWLKQLSDVVTNRAELLKLVKLDQDNSLTYSKETQIQKCFALRVPRTFIKKMIPGNSKDPLLLQVLTTYQELIHVSGYSYDPLNEQRNVVPGLLHKYKNRILLLVKNGCAIHCRYCFRRYFPYQNNPGNKSSWQIAIKYISIHTELDEVIFSGGDPLMAKDHEIAWLVKSLTNIPHIKRLRIHTRLPVVIPARITRNLCQIFSRTRLQILFVTHINHIQEIDDDLYKSMQLLKYSGVTLLNQSVLLRAINDNAQTLANLSNGLFNIGILPYYLHVMDKIHGAAHFFVSDDKARNLLHQLMEMVSGYMVPKLMREISGKPSKIPINLER